MYELFRLLLKELSNVTEAEGNKYRFSIVIENNMKDIYISAKTKGRNDERCRIETCLYICDEVEILKTKYYPTIEFDIKEENFLNAIKLIKNIIEQTGEEKI